jgi:succinate-acetate transporter protein
MAEPEERRTAAVAGSEASRTTAVAGIADPAPLGLAAFALTTFLLSALNAHLTRGGDAWLGYAFAYGGIAQLLAGMWEFRRNNTFGGTAFGSYGAFWLGLYFSRGLVANDLGWILLAFAIFNLYMLLCATRVNAAVTAVFLTLEITEIVLFIGNFSSNTSIIKVGGWIGIITALTAWYASFAGLYNSMGGRRTLPVGRPMDM